MAFGSNASVHPVKGLSASIMSLSHGKHHQGSQYESSAIFLESNTTNQSLLIFGDVEPDSVSGLSLNHEVWKETAKRISESRLSAMLIECSYCVRHNSSSRSKTRAQCILTNSFSSSIVFAAKGTAVWASVANIHGRRASRLSFSSIAAGWSGLERSEGAVERFNR